MSSGPGPFERVVDWPRISAVVRPDATGSLTINGTERPCRATDVDPLRTGIIARCVAIAARLRRPVRLTVQEGESTWPLAVRPEGVVQLIEEDGSIPPGDGLSVHEGPCRSCLWPQPVTAEVCSRCGVDEPHRVEAVHLDVSNVVPDVSVVSTLERARLEAARSGGPGWSGSGSGGSGSGGSVSGGNNQGNAGSGGLPPDGAPSHRPATRLTLRLTFSTQPAVDVAENVALGRNPAGVDGRLAVPVESPGRLMSRTHAFVDVDAEGRIIVTDNHSGNGVEAQTDPPYRFEPGVPYVIPPGTTLLLGDVSCTVRPV